MEKQPTDKITFCTSRHMERTKNHVENCHFCLTKSSGVFAENKKEKGYPLVDSVIPAVYETYDASSNLPVEIDAWIQNNTANESSFSSQINTNYELEEPHLIANLKKAQSDTEIQSSYKIIFMSKTTKDTISSS